MGIGIYLPNGAHVEARVGLLRCEGRHLHCRTVAVPACAAAGGTVRVRERGAALLGAEHAAPHAPCGDRADAVAAAYDRRAGGDRGNAARLLDAGYIARAERVGNGRAVGHADDAARDEAGGDIVSAVAFLERRRAHAAGDAADYPRAAQFAVVAAVLYHRAGAGRADDAARALIALYEARRVGAAVDLRIVVRPADYAADVGRAAHGGKVGAVFYLGRAGGVRDVADYAARPKRGAHLAAVNAVLHSAVVFEVSDYAADVVNGLHEALGNREVLNNARGVVPDVAEEPEEALAVVGEEHAVDRVAAAVEAAAEDMLVAVGGVAADGRPLVGGLVEIIPARPSVGAVEPYVGRQREVFAAVGRAVLHLIGEIRELRGGRDEVRIVLRAAAPRVGGRDAAVPHRPGRGNFGIEFGRLDIGLRYERRPRLLHGRVVIELDRH